MTVYARHDPNNPGTIDVRDFAAPPPASKGWLPLTVPAQPVPSATQVVVDAGIVFTPPTATQQWALRDKTAAELDTDAQAAERPVVQAMLDALTADIQAGAGTAPTTQAQAFAQIQALKVRALRTDRALRWLIKQQG